ncbi:MAG: ATP-binding protein [Planctomycetaceae bacterium]|nr:ATP-binding protein [Planctomycetaceae bacterium]
MDPRTNPFAPGAGNPPPELAGRDAIIEEASIALDRMRNGLSAKSIMLVGLRGVGKTVLLNRMHLDAEAKGIPTVMLDARERRSLPAILVPQLRLALLKLDRMAAAGDRAKRALRALGGFVQGMKLKYQDIEFGLNFGTEPGVANTGDLSADLTSLL